MTDWALFIKGISICNFSTPQGTNLHPVHGEECGCSHGVEEMQKCRRGKEGEECDSQENRLICVVISLSTLALF